MVTTYVNANVKYVNTFACLNYLRKICVFRISVSGRRKRICGAHILRKYAAHANVLTYFTFELTYVVTTYLFKYFKYAKGLLTHM